MKKKTMIRQWLSSIYQSTSSKQILFMFVLGMVFVGFMLGLFSGIMGLKIALDEIRGTDQDRAIARIGANQEVLMRYLMPPEEVEKTKKRFEDSGYFSNMDAARTTIILYLTASKYGLDRKRQESLIIEESAMCPWAVSLKGYKGLMQVGQFHCPEADLFDPVINIMVGMSYFVECKKIAGGDPWKAILLWNGSKSIDKPYQESIELLDRVKKTYKKL